MTRSPKLTTPPSTLTGVMRELLNTFPWVTLNHSTAVELLHACCIGAMHDTSPPGKQPPGFRSAPWWNEECHAHILAIIHATGDEKEYLHSRSRPLSSATLSGSTTPPYVRRLTLPTYGPLPSGAWAPEPLLFPLSGMGLALQLPQQVRQTCFCRLSSPHPHQVQIFPIQ